MLIIADSGSTKCTWVLADSDRIVHVRTEGINAIQQSPEVIRATLSQVPFSTQVKAVRFYGAGCGEHFPEARKRIVTALRERFACEDIRAESDLLAAARALYGRGKGIACILGTGSNSCLCCDGQIIQTVPPLGYILGDEGSGAALGRGLLNGVFKGHIPLRDTFLAASGLTYEQIISRVYREEGANRFLASLAPFVREHLDCPEVREMAATGFREFAARNLSRYPAGHPVSFVGGVAAHFEELLRETLIAEGYQIQTIVKSPAEGLLQYHNGE